MKSTPDTKSKWKKINKIILRVDSMDIVFFESPVISLDCGFENISRGRCKLSLNEKKNNQKNNLFIHSDKALMEVNIFYDLTTFEKLLKYISIKKNTLRKVKIKLNITDSLMVNQSGDLYVKDKTEIEVDQIVWNIPIL